MIDDELYVVQYLRAAATAGRRLPAERPRIYRVVAFSGDTVWGVNVDTQVLTRVNRDAGDGSGRVVNMQAFPDVAAARLAAERIAGEIDEEQAAEDERVAVAAQAKRAAQRVKYPAVVPLEDGPAGGGDAAAGDVQVGVSFTVKPAKPAEPQDLTDSENA